MHGRFSTALIILAVAVSPLAAEVASFFDQPTPFRDSRTLTKEEAARREALYQFALGLLSERTDSLFEALDAFKKSAELDPRAAAAFKEQIPLLLALDRDAEALTTSQKALDLDPADYEVWYIYARQLKAAGKMQQTRAALEQGLAVPAIKHDGRFALQMLLDLALLYEDQNAWLEAAKTYSKAAHLLDDSEATDFGPFSEKLTARRAAEIHEREGKMYAQASKYAEAVAAYQRAQERFPDDAGRLNFNLAQIAQKQGKLGQALSYLDAYLRMQPQGAEAYEQKIELLHKLDRKAEVLPWLEAVIQTDAFNTNVKLLLARQYARFGQSAAAEKVLLGLGEQAPSPEAYQALFELYRTDDNFQLDKGLVLIDETIRQAQLKQLALEPSHFTKQAKAMIAALRIDEASSEKLVQIGDRQVRDGGKLGEQTLHLLGALAFRQQKLAEAEHFYRATLALPTHESEALSYAGLLQVLWKANKYEAIEQLCRDGLRDADQKNHILLYNDLAKVLTRLERYDEALANVDKACKLADENDQLTLRHLRARILVHARQFTQAENECLDMLKNYQLPGEVLEIRYLLSVIYSNSKNLAKAEQQLDLVLQLDPNNATANNDLGYILADQNKDLAKAEELIRKAIDLDRRRQEGDDHTETKQDRAAYIDSLGWVLYRQGKFETAVHELEKAVRLPEGEDPTIWDHLGDAYQRSGRAAEARNAWQHALDLYDQQKTRRIDERYREIQEKLK